MSRTIDAKQSLASHWKLGILVNYHPNLERGISRAIVETGEELIDNEVDFVVKRGYGAGAAELEAHFNFIGFASVTKSAPISILMDGDQYDISDSRVRSGIDYLASSLRNRNLLWGVASRDNISLAESSELNQLRQIEEMFHVHAMGDIPVENPNYVDRSRVPEAFRTYGDPVPGLCAVNTNHNTFNELQCSVLAACRKADLTKYAGDPYVAMKASTLSKGIGVVMPVPQNPPSPFNEEQLTIKARELAKTDIGRLYFNAVNSEPRIKELEQHYGHVLVAKAQQLILQGFKESRLPEYRLAQHLIE